MASDVISAPLFGVRLSACNVRNNADLHYLLTHVRPIDWFQRIDFRGCDIVVMQIDCARGTFASESSYTRLLTCRQHTDYLSTGRNEVAGGRRHLRFHYLGTFYCPAARLCKGQQV